MILYLRKGVNYYMKKRNTAIRALSVFLAYAMVCTSVPAAGQEMFGSGVNRETEENTSDLKEFQSSQADEFGTDTGSDAELFGSDAVCYVSGESCKQDSFLCISLVNFFSSFMVI